MERWRSFFGKAGTDLWTIIQQAIVIAATDYPDQFKDKRCDIAEALFARTPRHGDLDGTRLSGSVVTNCTTTLRMEADEPRSNGQRSGKEADGNTGHGEQLNHREICSAQPHDGDDGLRESPSVFMAIQDIKAVLSDASQSDAAIIKALQTLESLHFSVDVLKATEIGKQVNNLRKHSCKEIRAISKGLVRHWKELVDNWVSTAGHKSSDPRGDSSAYITSGGDGADEGPSAVSYDCIPSSDEVQLGYYGIKSGSRLVELPEERGSSSRTDVSTIDRFQKSERRPQMLGSSARNIVNGSGPGRPFMDTPDGRPNGLSGSNGRSIKQPNVNIRSSCPPESKLENAKRRVHESHFQTENVKKQRASQMDLMDLPKRTLF